MFLFFTWSLFLSAVFTFLTYLTAFLFFSRGEPFGKINDVISVFQMLLMIPVAVLLVKISPPQVYILHMLMATVGIAGMIILATGQSLLVFNVIDFEKSLQFLPAGSVLGIWLIGTNILFILTIKILPFVPLFGILSGIGYILSTIGFLKKRQQSKLFYLGAAFSGFGYIVWAFWLGNLIASGALIFT